MLLVFLSAVFGFIFYPLSLAFSWLAYLPLKYEVEVIDYLASLSWASREVGNFSWIWVVLWYVALGSGVFYLNKEKSKKFRSGKDRDLTNT